VRPLGKTNYCQCQGELTTWVTCWFASSSSVVDESSLGSAHKVFKFVLLQGNFLRGLLEDVFVYWCAVSA
jgi:hypothetical protein